MIVAHDDKHCGSCANARHTPKACGYFRNLSRKSPDQPRGLAAITAYVLKHYAFLPQPIAVTVEGDEVVISYPEEADTKREEAARLAAASGEASAGEGDYEKAIGIYKRVA